jgi:hypothetical protein
LEEKYRTLEAKERKTAKDKRDLKQLSKEILPLKAFLEDAAMHRKAIKAEIGNFSVFCILFLFIRESGER